MQPISLAICRVPGGISFLNSLKNRRYLAVSLWNGSERNGKVTSNNCRTSGTLPKDRRFYEQESRGSGERSRRMSDLRFVYGLHNLFQISLQFVYVVSLVSPTGFEPVLPA